MEDDPIRIGGAIPGAVPLDLPDPDRACGHCENGVLGSPDPDKWLPGRLELEGDPVRFSVIQRCYMCELPSVITWTAAGGEDDVAVLKSSTQAPYPRPQALGIAEYKLTAIDGYHQEAWRCRNAGLRRAAMVMARSTLQACYRRYLPVARWGNYTPEMAAVAELAGEGWRKVAEGVRDFGNVWAHPDGRTSLPKAKDVVEAFRRMDAVLAFTAELERVGHLTAVTDEISPDGPLTPNLS